MDKICSGSDLLVTLGCIKVIVACQGFDLAIGQKVTFEQGVDFQSLIHIGLVQGWRRLRFRGVLDMERLEIIKASQLALPGSKTI